MIIIVYADSYDIVGPFVSGDEAKNYLKSKGFSPDSDPGRTPEDSINPDRTMWYKGNYYGGTRVYIRRLSQPNPIK